MALPISSPPNNRPNKRLPKLEALPQGASLDTRNKKKGGLGRRKIWSLGAHGQRHAKVIWNRKRQKTSHFAHGGEKGRRRATAILQQAVAITNQEAESVAFGTEAAYFQEISDEVIILGAGSIDVAHQPNEHLNLRDISAAVDCLRSLLYQHCFAEDS